MSACESLLINSFFFFFSLWLAARYFPAAEGTILLLHEECYEKAGEGEEGEKCHCCSRHTLKAKLIGKGEGGGRRGGRKEEWNRQRIDPGFVEEEEERRRRGKEKIKSCHQESVASPPSLPFLATNFPVFSPPSSFIVPYPGTRLIRVQDRHKLHCGKGYSTIITHF